MYIYIYIFYWESVYETIQVASSREPQKLRDKERERVNSRTKCKRGITGIICTTQSSQNSGATAPKRYAERHFNRNDQNASMISLKMGLGKLPFSLRNCKPVT